VAAAARFELGWSWTIVVLAVSGLAVAFLFLSGR
jgi:hypothetical protein